MGAAGVGPLPLGGGERDCLGLFDFLFFLPLLESRALGGTPGEFMFFVINYTPLLSDDLKLVLLYDNSVPDPHLHPIFVIDDNTALRAPVDWRLCMVELVILAAAASMQHYFTPPTHI